MMIIMRAIRSTSKTPEVLHAQEVLGNLDAIVTRTNGLDIYTGVQMTDVFIPRLGLQAALVRPPHSEECQVGTQLKVAVRDVKFDVVPRLFVVLSHP